MNAKTAAAAAATYELCFDPAEGDTFIYRNLPAGICGPFSQKILATDRLEAATWALGQGYIVSGEWSSHLNGDTVALTRIA